MLNALTLVSCNKINNMFKGNNTKFHWTPTVAAPRNYPVELDMQCLSMGIRMWDIL